MFWFRRKINKISVDNQNSESNRLQVVSQLEKKKDKSSWYKRWRDSKSYKPASLLLLLLIAFIAFFYYGRFAKAGTHVWDGGGDEVNCPGASSNWSCAFNWSDDTVPDSQGDVIFNGTNTKDSIIDNGFAGTITSLTIESGYSGTITQQGDLIITGSFSQAAGDYIVNGTAWTAGSIGISNGTFNGGTGIVTAGSFGMSGGGFVAPNGAGTLKVGSFSVTGGNFDHSNGSVAFVLLGALTGPYLTIDPGGAIFYDVYFDNIDVSVFGGQWIKLISDINATHAVYAACSGGLGSTSDIYSYSIKGDGNPIHTPTIYTKDLHVGGSGSMGWLTLGGGTVNDVLDVHVTGDYEQFSSSSVFANLWFDGVVDQHIEQSNTIDPNSCGWACTNFSYYANKPSGTLILDTDFKVSGYYMDFTLLRGNVDLNGHNFTADGYVQTGGTFNGSTGTIDLNAFFMDDPDHSNNPAVFNSTTGNMIVSGWPEGFYRAGGTFNHNGGTVTINVGDLAAGYTQVVTNMNGTDLFFNLVFDNSGAWNQAGIPGRPEDSGPHIRIYDSFNVVNNLTIRNTTSEQNGAYRLIGLNSPDIRVKGDIEFPETASTIPVLVEGTIDMFLEGDFIISDNEASCYANITFDKSNTESHISQTAGRVGGNWTVNSPGKNVYQDTDLDLIGRLVVESGVFDMNHQDLVVTSDITMHAGYFYGRDGEAEIGSFGISQNTPFPTEFNAPTGNLTIHGDYGRSGGAFNHSSSTVIFSLRGEESIDITTGSNGEVLFNNVIFDNFDATHRWGDPDQLGFYFHDNITINGDLSIQNTTHTVECPLEEDGYDDPNCDAQREGDQYYVVMGKNNPVVTVKGDLKFPSTAEDKEIVVGTPTGSWDATKLFTFNLEDDFVMEDDDINFCTDVKFTNSNNISNIWGSTTFGRNFSVLTPNKQLNFEAGSRQTVVGSFILNGGSRTSKVKLRSETEGQYWEIDPRGARSVKFVDVQDSTNVNPTDIRAEKSTDSGRNIKWIFVNTPTVRTDDPLLISDIAFRANGYIEDTGGTPVTLRGFEYRELGSATIWEVSDSSASWGIGAFTRIITNNLTTGRTYEVRAFAVNDDGRGEGEWRQIVLASEPVSNSDGGKCIFGGNNSIRAVMFCQDEFSTTVGQNNYEFIGSFVSKAFTNMENSSNILFNYDYYLNRYWPPGFRTLILPFINETN